MPIFFLKKSSGKKPAAAAPPPAAEPTKPKPSPHEEAAGAMEHVMTGAEYPPHSRRLKNIQMVRYNFDDDLYDGDYYYGTQEMYYPNHGGYHPHALVAPPYHPGMRHMSVPPPQYSNSLPPPPPYGHGHYPPVLPQRHFSPAPPPWQRFSPAPAPWGQFGPRQHFGPPRRHFGPPRRPFAPPMGHDYYGLY